MSKKSQRQESKFPGFSACIKMLHSKDAMTQEAGYQWLQSHVKDYVDAFLIELDTEEDPHIQGWILELVGEACDTQGFPYFIRFILSSNWQVHSWSRIGLQKVKATKEGHRFLWDAYLYGGYLPSKRKSLFSRRSLKSCNSRRWLSSY
jgi:hypothetical protein